MTPPDPQQVAEIAGRLSKLQAAPIAFADAAVFVQEHHRHHTPPAGHKFSIAAVAADRLVGVVIVGRPVSRHRDDGLTLEVTRLCTVGHPNACSFLYGAAARAAFALGYARIGTYTLKSEPGTSLKAAGWRLIGETPGRSWSVPSRPRADKHPIEPKLLWEAA
ncbi:XF1762 family protein [Sphingomonas abaci]|uniref:GNAT family N-acetyltransferase n=1 Tax=Sphingomonas abaci TaxID=237611 RepID=A0A7W7EXC5_9SPHN|nr:XF1762 family protein [Sphingomonas abaci]MBB4616951.1 hypothetical protein [Sphingomonas abaci]